MSKTKLIGVLLGLAAVLAVAGVTGMAVQWPPALDAALFVLAAGSGLLALALMLRRAERTQTAYRALLRGIAGRLADVEREVMAQRAGHDELSTGIRQLARQIDDLPALDGLYDETRRLGEAIDESSRLLGETIGTLDQRQARLAKRMAPGRAGIEETTRRLVERDMNALLTLHLLFGVRGEPAPTTSFSATPSTLVALAQEVSTLGPEDTVLEAGSGASTMWMALAAEKTAAGPAIVALEHDEAYAEATRVAIQRQHLAGRVDVAFAPLTAQAADGVEVSWYDFSALDLPDVRLFFIDGPPAASGPDARFPAFPLLFDRLVDGAAVVLDDTDRPDEQSCIERWQEFAAKRGARLEIERQLDRSTFLRLHRDGAAAAVTAAAADDAPLIR